MHKPFLFVGLMCWSLISHAQDKLEADRPGESRSSELVKGNHLQVETGFRMEKLEDKIHLYQHPRTTFRYGLFNAIELRAELTSQTIRNKVSKERVNGLKPVEFGVKAKILPEYKGFPSLALLGEIGVPGFSSQDYYNPRIPFQFRALFGNTFSKSFKLQYNAGVRWEGEDRTARWMYSFSPVFQVSERVNLFIEEYAFLGKTAAAEHYFDGGLDFYLGNDFMLDFSAGVGLSESSSPYFFAAGATFRLSAK